MNEKVQSLLLTLLQEANELCETLPRLEVGNNEIVLYALHEEQYQLLELPECVCCLADKAIIKIKSHQADSEITITPKP